MAKPPLRVMICDDSSVMRRILSTVLGEDSEIEVVHEAVHGKDALDHLDSARPDIVVLDVEMPVMDGIETVVAIRQKSSTLPIIMFSSLTAKGAEATLDALAAGANDFATKPSGIGHLGQAIDIVRTELLSRIKSFCRPRSREAASVAGKSKLATTKRWGPAEVVAIGVSTGGPLALQTLLSKLPRDFSAPILVVQHMPPAFTTILAERLNAHCELNVREAVNGAIVKPGDVWIARGDYHMEVERTKDGHVLKLHQQPLENSVRPAVDPLFRSIAECYGSRGLCVVLTGMGKDGLEGSRAVRRQGGLILAQDRASSTVWGMPREVVEAGLAECVAALNDMPLEIVRRTRPSQAMVVESTLG